MTDRKIIEEAHAARAAFNSARQADRRDPYAAERAWWRASARLDEAREAVRVAQASRQRERAARAND